jgi:hypothetical protein
VTWKLLALAVGLGLGCRDLDRFDTGDSGAYCGNIIDGEFTRRGFEAGLGMRLTLDIDALHVAPGVLSTNDAEAGPCAPQALFENAPLSLLEFGAIRDFNFVSWVDSTCQGSALAVVSLMHTGQVEVRLLRRNNPTEQTDSPGNFGVFQLQRTDCEY